MKTASKRGYALALGKFELNPSKTEILETKLRYATSTGFGRGLRDAVAPKTVFSSNGSFVGSCAIW